MNENMTTRVYLIRHGETVDADSRRYKGHTDVPLSAKGVQQIERLAEYLLQTTEHRAQRTDDSPQKRGVDAVYCSGLSRAVTSADIIARPFGLAPVVHDGLKERNFGAWEGMTFDEIQQQWPDAFQAWAGDPETFSPLDGESTFDVRDRAMRTFNEIVSGHHGESIAIVSHGGITRVVLCEMFGMPLKHIFRIEQDFAALNIIDLWDYPVVKTLNYVLNHG